MQRHKLLLGALLAVCAAGASAQRLALLEQPLDISHSAGTDTKAAAEHQRYVADLTQLGRAIFEDKTLSGNGKMGCVSCHSPAHAFSAPNKQPVQMGGLNGRLAGTRAAPSLQYLQTSPIFTEHYFEDEGAKAGQDNGPTGGFTWDGRVDTLHDQARIPLFSANEMATTPAKLAARLSQASYADSFKKLFGANVFDRSDVVVDKALMALETYQQSPDPFYPYTSKYDAVLRGQATLSQQEARGLAVFNQTDKGNCASCHPSGLTENGGLPQFTDYGFAALGLPRNMKIPANARGRYFDKGLCGPQRGDLSDNAEYCGLFKVPSLRNVALKNVFYHNAAATDLESAVRFYAERDAHPERWYPKGASGHVRKFNDLPAKYRENIETDSPFGQKRGKPDLSNADVKDIVAFLKTLTDGYKP